MEHSSESCGTESHTCCNHSVGSEVGVRQTLSEMEFERGIWYAAQNDDLDRVKSLLRKGIAADLEDSAGYTALHYAARGGHCDICKVLLENGAHVNAVTRCGHATSLHRSSMRGKSRVVELLLNSGADPNIRDADGYTALHRAVLAASRTVCNLLIPVTDLTIRDNNSRTALQLARQGEHFSIVDLFDNCPAT